MCRLDARNTLARYNIAITHNTLVLYLDGIHMYYCQYVLHGITPNCPESHTNCRCTHEQPKPLRYNPSNEGAVIMHVTMTSETSCNQDAHQKVNQLVKPHR